MPGLPAGDPSARGYLLSDTKQMSVLLRSSEGGACDGLASFWLLMTGLHCPPRYCWQIALRQCAVDRPSRLLTRTGPLMTSLTGLWPVAQVNSDFFPRAT